MPPKRNNPLREQQGIAMIMVLCLGALFVALSAALVYAASLMMANANRQLPEQDVQELAVSFSDVLDQELQDYTGVKMDDKKEPIKDEQGNLQKDDDGSLGYFINYNYVRPEDDSGRQNNYGVDTDHTFTLEAPDGVDELTVTLRKTIGDDNDDEENIVQSYTVAGSDVTSLNQNLKGREESCSEAGLHDYDITVTVKVVKGDQSCSYTRKYQHTGFYELYYTFGNNRNAKYTRQGMEGTDTLVFDGAASTTYKVTASTTDTIYLRYRMDTATRCRFDRITTDN